MSIPETDCPDVSVAAFASGCLVPPREEACEEIAGFGKDSAASFPRRSGNCGAGSPYDFSLLLDMGEGKARQAGCNLGRATGGSHIWRASGLQDTLSPLCAIVEEAGAGQIHVWRMTAVGTSLAALRARSGIAGSRAGSADGGFPRWQAAPDRTDSLTALLAAGVLSLEEIIVDGTKGCSRKSSGRRGTTRPPNLRH